MKKLVCACVLLLVLMSSVFSLDLLWRGVPWGSRPELVLRQVGEKETREATADGNLLIQWGYTATIVGFENARMSNVFTIVEIQPGTDWADVAKDLLEQYSAMYKMWPAKPSIDDIMVVLRHPEHQNLLWFAANVHNKWSVVWYDAKGNSMMMTAAYDNKADRIYIRFLMSPKKVAIRR